VTSIGDEKWGSEGEKVVKKQFFGPVRKWSGSSAMALPMNVVVIGSGSLAAS